MIIVSKFKLSYFNGLLEFDVLKIWRKGTVTFSINQLMNKGSHKKASFSPLEGTRKYILWFPSTAFRRSRESASPSRRSPAPLLEGEEETHEFISGFSSRQMAQARSQCYSGDNPVSQRPTSYSQLARRVIGQYRYKDDVKQIC